MNAHKYVAIALALFAMTFVACNDEEDIDFQNDFRIENDNSSFSVDKKVKIQLDHYIKDTKGNLWHIKGTIEVNLWKGTASFDVTLTNVGEGKSYPFRGSVNFVNQKVESIDGNLYNEDGKPIPFSELPELNSLLEECWKIVQEIDNKNGTNKMKSSEQDLQLTLGEYTMTDSEGNSVTVEEFPEIVELLDATLKYALNEAKEAE